MDSTKEKEVEDEYLSSLMDLNVNSKPLINMLTMLAEDNLECAPVIVRAIEKHITQVNPDAKLPILYLIDSIVKNVGSKYKQFFAQNIVSIFCDVFKKCNEKVREKMFNLRQTWNEVFPQTKLYALDVKVNVMDSNWPITAKVVPKSVHVNPNFLKSNPDVSKAPPQQKDVLFHQMQAKERELLQLKQRKIELELMVTKKKIAEQEKEIQQGFMLPTETPLSAAAGALNTPINPGMKMLPHHTLPPHHGRVRITPASAAMVSSARSRDPRLSKMRIQPSATKVGGLLTPSFPMVPPTNSIRSLPRIPKHNKSSSSSSSSNLRDDREERDPRKRRDKDRDEKSSSKSSDPRSKSSSSSLKSSPTSKKFHESPRKRSEDEKRGSSKSSQKSSSSSSSKAHSSSKSPNNGYKSPSEPKDVDLRIVTDPNVEDATLPVSMDVDMRPDSTTTPANSSKLNKNKLLNELLQDEDRSSQDSLISTSYDNEQLPKGDTDLRFVDHGKKRSMSSEPLEAEPSPKKNRSENNTGNSDLLFGNQDVDLRTTINEAPLQSEKKSLKVKDKSDFEAVRAKLNASKSRHKTGGIKILDELPRALSPIENGTSEFVKKMLQKKKGDSRDDVHESQPSFEEQSITVPSRKEKRKETKWSQPTVAPTMPWTNSAMPSRMNMNSMPAVSTSIKSAHHFMNPWESNPMVISMQKASQMPLVVPQSCHQPVLNNKMRTLRLDGTRDHLLRFYGEIAIIFNETGEAHDIRFSAGQSKVVIDDMYSVMLDFNDSYKPVVIEGVQYQIKFGTPTRELYIDDNFYECYFNNQTTQIILGNKVRHVRIEGKAPEVKIGQQRNDIVLGLINMMIDAEIVVPVFLDTTAQYFEYKNKIFTLQFADFFLSVIINNEPFKVEFGGLPKNYLLNGQKHFIRFTVLPEDVSPGHVNMRGMVRTHLFKNCKSPPLIDNSPSPQLSSTSSSQIDITKLVENDMNMQPLQNQSQNHGQQKNHMPSESNNNADDQGTVNINELLQKLIDQGIIGGSQPSSSAAKAPAASSAPQQHVSNNNNNRKKKEKEKEEERPYISPVNLSRPETIKKRQQAIVDSLYTGIQCGSCGLRFPPEQTTKYSQHLDWHFRQNRRERDSKRKAHSRKWYYNRSDWIQYEEIEDSEEREKNYFETQQMEAMDQGEDSNAGRSVGNQESSCPAGSDDVNRCCDMCHDQFEQFFNEETEEWHLRSAIKIDDRFFHPICYEDYKTSLTLDESGMNADNSSQINDDDIEMTDVNGVIVKAEKVYGDNLEINPDDDDVIVLPAEEPIITEIPDEGEDETLKAEKAEESVQVDQTLNATDDDVMINEPKIEVHQVYDDEDEKPVDKKEISHTPLIVKIKEEPKDDGYDEMVNEEDAFVEVTSINEDYINDDTHSPFQPALDDNAIFDESSQMMMMTNSDHNLINDDHLAMADEGSSRPDSNNAPTNVGGIKKLKIVLSSLAQQTNLTNKQNINNLNNHNVMNDQNNTNTDASSNLESVNKLDSNSLIDLHKQGAATSGDAAEEARGDEKELVFEVKPHLRDFKFEKNSVPVKRGFENSGLCSIM